LKVGAEPKKIGILAALLLLAGITYYVMSGDSPSSVANTTRQPVPVESVAPVNGSAAAARRNTNRNLVREFKPSMMRAPDPKDRPDPATIDPTLRLDLLAKVQNIELGPPGRNLFQFGAAPAPAAPIKFPTVGKIVTSAPPPTAPPTPAGPPPPPQAPQMTFKYYGYKVSTSDGHKAAFLLDGEDILIAGENDTVKKRYRVVKIGINSITIEDTQFKSTQTLPLQENLAG
jgi:hypothetical protein